MNPLKKITVLKSKGNIELVEVAIIWGPTPYVYYTLTGQKPTKDYFTALKQYNQIINA